MKSLLILVFSLFSVSCGENFLQLASEYGNYTTQQVRDIEELRRVADDCDYEKECFKEEVDQYIQDFCSSGEYELRGYISQKECKRQYPYVFLKLFETSKYASIDAIEEDEEYNEALRIYRKAVDDLNEAKEDYEEAKRDWADARCPDEDRRHRERDRTSILERSHQRFIDEECEEAREDWIEANEDYDEAWEDYDEAWDDYEEAKRRHRDFFHE